MELFLIRNLIFVGLFFECCAKLELADEDVTVTKLSVMHECDYTVKNGDYFTVDYDAKLSSGMIIHSSSESIGSDGIVAGSNGQPESFVLGDDLTPSPLNIGVKNMCVGDIRQLTFSADALGDEYLGETVTYKVKVTKIKKAQEYIAQKKFWLACEKGDIVTVTQLANSVSFDEVDRNGRTAILIATRAGQASVSRFLLAHGADPNDSLPSGLTALMQAAGVGARAAVQALIQAGADLNSVVSSGKMTGYTALHFAASWGYHEIVTMLIQKGAHATALTPLGETPLDLARKQAARESGAKNGGKIRTDDLRRIKDSLSRIETLFETLSEL